MSATVIEVDGDQNVVVVPEVYGLAEYELCDGFCRSFDTYLKESLSRRLSD